MKFAKNCFIFFYIFTQTILSCDEQKDTEIKKRSRAEFTLSKSPQPLFGLAAYSALLEDALKPSEPEFPSLSEENISLQKLWDQQHSRNLSPDLSKAIGERSHLILHIPHLFKPLFKTLPQGTMQIHGFHHDPGRNLENSGLLRIEGENRYADGSYKQTFLTKTTPHIRSEKTFFPDYWTRSETIQALLSALRNSKQSSETIGSKHTEFIGIAATTPPLVISFRIKIGKISNIIHTAHPKH